MDVTQLKSWAFAKTVSNVSSPHRQKTVDLDLGCS